MASYKRKKINLTYGFKVLESVMAELRAPILSLNHEAQRKHWKS